jgi:hypothetical protein
MRIERRAVVFLASAIWLAMPALAAASQETPIDTLAGAEIDHTLNIGFETKLSSIGSEFANSAGMTFTMGMNDRFEIGLGAFGRTNHIDRVQLGYGGLVLGYNLHPDRTLHASFRALIGAGHVNIPGARDHNLFVAEPEVELTINVSRTLRIGAGIGYRFVGGAAAVNRDLRGWSGSLSVGLVLFRN